MPWRKACRPAQGAARRRRLGKRNRIGAPCACRPGGIVGLAQELSAAQAAQLAALEEEVVKNVEEAVKTKVDEVMATEEVQKKIQVGVRQGVSGDWQSQHLAQSCFDSAFAGQLTGAVERGACQA